MNVKRFKYIHICVGCGIMGLGGNYRGLNMSGLLPPAAAGSNGSGWIAVALVIFAIGNPALASLGTFRPLAFFSTLRVSGSSRAAGLPRRPGLAGVSPHPALSGLPFLITAVVLVATSVRKREGLRRPRRIGD